MDSMSKKHGHIEGLDNIRDKARAMFTSLYDATAAHEQSQQEANMDELPAISKHENGAMKEATAELRSAYIVSDSR